MYGVPEGHNHAVMQVKMHVKEHDTGHGKEMYKQVECCYALGDCCANMELPLPALAQVVPARGYCHNALCDIDLPLLFCSCNVEHLFLGCTNDSNPLPPPAAGWLKLQESLMKP